MRSYLYNHTDQKRTLHSEVRGKRKEARLGWHSLGVLCPEVVN